MAKYVVTGGAGFIGLNIVQELVHRRQEVIIFDRAQQIKKNHLLDNFRDKVKFISGDINDLKLLQKTFKGVDFVLHQAALASVAGSIQDPHATNKINIEGTLKVLIAARDQKVKRVVFASSSAIYGDNPAPIKSEDFQPAPLSPYALSKLTGEYYCRLFSKLYGLETVCLRYFNVFGPGQDPKNQYAAVIPAFITQMIKNIPPVIYGDGSQSRDFIFVQDIAKANILAATTPGISGQVFNIASGRSLTLNQLVDLINKTLKTKIKPIYKPGRPGDVKTSQADIRRAKRLLKFKPTFHFENALAKTIQWYKNGPK